MRFYFQILIFTILSLHAYSQPEVNFNEVKNKYPDIDIYYINVKSHVTIDIVNDKLDISETNLEDLLYLTDRASIFSKKSIYYYDVMESVSEKDIHALTYVPKENKYKKLDVTEIYTRNPSKDGIFYDDYQEKHFLLPGLQPGAVSSISYTEKLKEPHLMSSFFFGRYFPVRTAEYSITFPKNVTLKYVINGDTSNIHFSQEEKKGKITYTWKIDDVRAYKEQEEERSPNVRYYIPHIIPYIAEYTVNGKTTNVLSDTRQLYSWYRYLIHDCNKDISPELKSLVDSLVKDTKDETEKIEKLYYWVQDNIKYIALYEGLGGFVPRNASLVYSRKFGDCKDKSSILNTMLTQAGIRSYLTWIGTRDIPYSYEQVPTPQADNHMIVAVWKDNQWMFLDGTASNLPFGYPSGFIQGKEALIGYSPDSFIVAKVPVVHKEQNTRCDSLLLSIDDKILVGKGSAFFTGLWRNHTVNEYSSVDSKDVSEKMSKLFEVGNNKYKVDSLTFTGFYDYSDTLKYNYNISIPDYLRKVDSKVYVNLNLDKVYQNDNIDTTLRKNQMTSRYRYILKSVYALKTPQGYHINSIPQDSKYDNELFGYSIKYTRTQTGVVMERTCYSNYLELPADKFTTWNKMVSDLKDAYSEMVVLEKN